MKIFLNIILIAGLIAISSAYHNEKCVTIPPDTEGELTSEPTPEPTPEPTRIAEPCLREVELCNEKDFKICTELYRFSKAGCAELTQDKHLSARTKGPYKCVVHSGTDCIGDSAFVTQSGANYPFEIQSVSCKCDYPGGAIPPDTTPESTSEPTLEPTPEPTRIAEPCLREVELCNEKDFKICTELYRFSKAGCAELTQDKHLSARTKGPYMCEVHSGTDCLGESAFVTQSGANYPFEIQSVSCKCDYPGVA